MKSCSSVPIFGKEFEQFLKAYYDSTYIQLKVITEKRFFNEKATVTSILLHRPSPQLLLLIEVIYFWKYTEELTCISQVNEALEIQNAYLMKIFMELKELTPEDHELLKEFKKVVFQWIWKFVSEN